MTQGPKYLVLLVFVVIVAVSASANSVSLGHAVALQHNGLTQVDLFANPGVTLRPTTLTQLSLLVPLMGTIPNGAGNTLAVTAVIMSSAFTQSFLIPAGTYSNFSQFLTFTFPSGIAHSVPVKLSVQLFSDGGRLLASSNYSFNFVESGIARVPETGTLLLLGSGIVMAMFRRRSTV